MTTTTLFPPRAIPADELRTGTYAEFLYGRGDAPGLDLGAALAYSRSGSVYRQEFAYGLTLANVGDVPAEVDLEPGYATLDGAPLARLTLPPRSAEVLVRQ